MNGESSDLNPESSQIQLSQIQPNLIQSSPTTGSSQDEAMLDIFCAFDDVSFTSESEVSKYLKHPIKSRVDPVHWWIENHEMYPNLFMLFLKVSCVTATSASSERVFSTTGNIVTDKRSLILPMNVNNIVVVRSSFNEQNKH